VEWLIDQDGRQWPGRSHRIAQWDAESNPFGFAVTELGFIHVKLLGRGAHLSFNPHKTERLAMVGAFYLIADIRPIRILLSHGPSPEGTEIVARDQFFPRLSELLQVAPSPLVWKERRQSLDRPLARFAPALASVLEIWCQQARRLNSVRMPGLDDLLDTAALIRRPRGSDRLIIEHWGADRDFLSSKWPEIARGKEVQDQPGAHRAEHMAARYSRTLNDGTPRLHDVDLIVPTAQGRTRRAFYQRLLLPWQGLAGDAYVMSLRFT
jgi:hypothetical protein